MNLDIKGWLHGIGLGQYAETLRANDVDFDVLRTLTEVDLKELGLSLGDRKRLMQAIATRAEAVPSEAPATTQVAVTPAPAAERRQLTVMFVDLVGSTALSQRLDPEEMRHVLKTYQNMVAGEIGRLEGFTAQLLGDGVLAYFGWPRTHEDEAERAVRAGLAVIAAMSGLQRTAGEPLMARVGIATGLVVVGDLMGDGGSQEQAAVGDTPNLAARLQACAEPGMVVISEATRRLLGDSFILRSLRAQTFKGIDGPVPAFAVLGERALESRFAARHSGVVAPIVGRDQELALLLERWRQAKSGEGQVVLLTGEAGIGKSRITEALVEQVAAEPRVLIRYQCSPYHTDSALYPVIQQITFAAGFSSEDTADRRLDRLEALLAGSTDDLREAAPLIATLMGLDGATRYGELTLAPQQRRTRTLAVLVDQLVGLAKGRPVLWVVEDAHWIDPTTLELIELALDRIQGIEVLALITARPTFAASFASHPVVTRVALNRLARAATQAIVSRVTSGKHLPAALVDEIAARTDGVPLFVEEMTKAVLESGGLRETADAFHLAGPLNALAIPATLHDSLMARLDRLHPVKEVAQIAAIIGRSFEHKTVAALTDLSEPELADAMRKLVEAELVFRRGTPPEATYLFKHALVRDAAYESLLKSRRQALHLRLFVILQSGGSAAPEVLAQHAQAGGDAGQAISWWQKAAEAAISRAAFEEAETHLGAALALLPAIDDVTKRKREDARIAIARAQASLVRRGYGHDRTNALYAQADALAEAADDPRLFMLARYGVWAVYHVREDVGHALELAEQMLERVSQWKEPQFSMMAYRLLSGSQTMAGRFREARISSEAARKLYDPERDAFLGVSTGTHPLVGLNSYSAFAELALGFPDRARALADEGWDVVQTSGEVNTKAYAMWHRAVLAALAGESVSARELAEDLVSYAGLRGLLFWEAMAKVNVAWGMFATGDPIGAAEAMPGAIDAVEATGGGLFGALYRSVLAEALGVTGRATAIEAIAVAEALARHSRALYGLAEIQRREGVILRRLRPGEGAEAEAAFRRALATAREQGARLWELRAATDLARLMVEQRRRAEARDLLAPIYGWFTEGFQTADLKNAKALLDAL
jgi:class 3 adenylate cyclase/tetratricopeptide (TPR) repeat protein